LNARPPAPKADSGHSQKTSVFNSFRFNGLQPPY
jgi:hypothetical protein